MRRNGAIIQAPVHLENPTGLDVLDRCGCPDRIRTRSPVPAVCIGQGLREIYRAHGDVENDLARPFLAIENVYGIKVTNLGPVRKVRLL